MDLVRYYMALLLVVVLPPLLLLWLLIHPFVGFWRRVGPVCAYSLIGGLIALAAAGLFLVRKKLLALEFGTNYLLILLGALLFTVAVWLRVLLHRHLSIGTMLGLPELAPERYPVQLITEGLYARIRHPRYVQFALAILSSALVANYLALYLAVALWFLGIYVIVILEEKELRARFGAAYDEYCRRVPKFFPKYTHI